MDAYAVHAIIPIMGSYQRQSMRTSGYSLDQRAATMFIERFDLTGWELPIAFVFIRFQRLRAQEWNCRFKNRAISRHTHIVSRDIRQPKQIIRTACAQPASRGWVPPVKHITFLKLVSRGFKDMLTNQIR